MKQQLALVALLALTAIGGFYMQNSTENFLESAQDLDMATYQRFVQWQAEHGKDYSQQNDEMYRFTIFAENLQFIEAHNAKGEDLLLGLTRFADLTNEEFKAQMTSNIVENPTAEYYEEENLEASDVNGWDSLDWVQKGAVTSVKNQGSCGSCWAFASVAALEGLRATQEGTLESLSNQQLTSCVNIPIPGAGGCHGGNTFFAWIYTKNNPVLTEQALPYENGSTGKTIACSVTKQEAQKEGVFSNKGQGQVTPNSPSDMYKSLQNQPLAITVDAGSIYFQLYNSGVIKSENCGTALNHAITLVGYDSQTNSWKVKNSWGTGWGLSGYGQILNTEGNGICGINMGVSYPTL